MSKQPRITTVKKTLSGGRGAVPDYQDGTKAIFDYEAFKPLVNVYSEGFPDSMDLYGSIDSTKKPYPHGYGKPLELVFGKKFQLPVFETCLRSMLVDEISQFDIDVTELYPYPQVASKLRNISRSEMKAGGECDCTHTHRCALGGFGTGYPELDELMKDPKPLRFRFHLLKVLQIEEYEPERWQLSHEEKLKSVSELRRKGNDLFKEGKYEDASFQYREALTRLDNLLLEEKPGDPEWLELDEQNVILFLNLSQCHLNLGQHYEAIATASEALKRDVSNEKALFRRAKAQIAVWNLEAAEQDLEKLVDCNAAMMKLVQQEKLRIGKLKEERNKDRKGVYKNMFKKESKES